MEHYVKKMEISKEKTNVIVIANKNKNIRIHVNEEKTEQVKDFMHLGSIFESKGRQGIELTEQTTSPSKQKFYWQKGNVTADKN